MFKKTNYLFGFEFQQVLLKKKVPRADFVMFIVKMNFAVYMVSNNCSLSNHFF